MRRLAITLLLLAALPSAADGRSGGSTGGTPAGGGSGVPAALPAARGASPAHALVLFAEPAVRMDAPVRLRVTPRAGASYRWDLDGNGSYETTTGATAVVVHAFSVPGRLRIGVEAIVAARPVEAVSREISVVRAPARAAPPRPRRVVTRAGHPRPTYPAPRRTLVPVPVTRAVARVRAAAAGAVAISDFRFGPAAATIHVGDTVTWVNRGPTAHTATASDHSFDTGVLGRGQSASHAFTRAGTVGYVCTLHPFMKATVTVLAAPAAVAPHAGKKARNTSGGHPAASASPPSAAPGSSAAAATAPVTGSALPTTGMDLPALALAGLVLLTAGLALRRIAAARA